ncbi:hypothetical protein BH23CHL5_BH23CHL5_19030 [soil metagenome]
MSTLSRMFGVLSAVILMGAVVVSGSIGTLAQDGEVQVENQMGGQFVSIHEGSCDSPVAASSWDVGEAYLPGTGPEDDEAGEVRGSTDAVAVLILDETVGTNFGEVLDEGQYILAVHRDSENFGDIVACGALGGVVDDGRLVVGLAPVSDSGIQGVAVIDEDSSGFLGLGDDQLSVRVYLLVDIVLSDDMDQTNGMATPVTDEEMDDDMAATVEADTDDMVSTPDDADMDDDASPEAEG